MAALLPKSEEEEDDPANNVVDEEAEPKALEAGVGEVFIPELENVARVGDASPSALELELNSEDEALEVDKEVIGAEEAPNRPLELPEGIFPLMTLRA